MWVKSLLLESILSPLQFKDFEMIPEPGQVEISLRAAALNRRDWWICKGQYANIRLPAVLGSDGCGVYEGREVILLPAVNWGPDNRFQGAGYRIMGMPLYGTFAQRTYAFKEQIYDKPAHLTSVQAACLPLAGLTAWRALMTKCTPHPGENILISGVGGGVAGFAFQFALALGLNVYVTSGSDEKIEKAKNMGAKGGVNYHSDNFHKDLMALCGGFDIVIDSAAGTGLASLVNACAPGARICFYGGTAGKINNLSPQVIFWKQLSILGSTMGTPDEFEAMLNFVNLHKIVPIVDHVFDLSEGNEALELMGNHQQFGRIALSINS